MSQGVLEPRAQSLRGLTVPHPPSFLALRGQDLDLLDGSGESLQQRMADTLLDLRKLGVV